MDQINKQLKKYKFFKKMNIEIIGLTLIIVNSWSSLFYDKKKFIKLIF